MPRMMGTVEPAKRATAVFVVEPGDLVCELGEVVDPGPVQVIAADRRDVVGDFLDRRRSARSGDDDLLDGCRNVCARGGRSLGGSFATGKYCKTCRQCGLHDRLPSAPTLLRSHDHNSPSDL